MSLFNIKNKKVFNKKGISPLIATVLLILFAVTLGVIIMNWGKSYSEDQIEAATKKSNEELECELYIDLAVKEIAGEPQLYYSNSTGNLTFMLENRGSKTIDSIRVTIIGQNAQDINITDISDSSISPAGVLKKDVIYTNASVDQVIFTPYLNTTGSSEPTLCTRSKLEKDDIPSKA